MCQFRLNRIYLFLCNLPLHAVNHSFRALTCFEEQQLRLKVTDARLRFLFDWSVAEMMAPRTCGCSSS
jgi:hypothetical protein